MAQAMEIDAQAEQQPEPRVTFAGLEKKVFKGVVSQGRWCTPIPTLVAHIGYETDPRTKDPLVYDVGFGCADCQGIFAMTPEALDISCKTHPEQFWVHIPIVDDVLQLKKITGLLFTSKIDWQGLNQRSVWRNRVDDGFVASISGGRTLRLDNTKVPPFWLQLDLGPYLLSALTEDYGPQSQAVQTAATQFEATVADACGVKE